MTQPFQISRHTPFEDLPKFLTPEECCVYLGLSRAMIYDLLRRGEISSIKFGELIRVPKTALEPPKPTSPSRSLTSREL